MTTISYTLTNAGLDLLRDGASGSNNPKVTYVALGTGNSSPVATQTQLDAEVFRKAVTSYTDGAAHGEILLNDYIAPGDTNGTNIAEVAWFGGSSASSIPNTGIMLARGLYTHTKSNTESLQLQLDLTL